MALNEVISLCINRWRAEGLRLALPISEADIRRVWSELDQRISADVLEFYTTIGGFQEYDFDDAFFWSLWPWDWLQKRNKESPSNGVMFCDHSIEIQVWELRFENPSVSSVWNVDGHQCWPSLEVFLEQYLEDPWQLL